MTDDQKKELQKYIKENQDEAREGPGRTLSLTWEMLAIIKGLLFEGQFQKYVFMSMGIPKTTWDSWRINGEKLLAQIQSKKKKYKDLKPSEEKYLYFAYLVSVGRAKSVLKHQRIVMEAGKTEWRASAWVLEMMDRGLFGQKVDQNVNLNTDMKSLQDAYDRRMKNKK